MTLIIATSLWNSGAAEWWGVIGAWAALGVCAKVVATGCDDTLSGAHGVLELTEIS